MHMLVVWRKTGERRGRIGVEPPEAGAATMILRRTVRTADCPLATGLMHPTETASRRFAPRSDGYVSSFLTNRRLERDGGAVRQAHGQRIAFAAASRCTVASAPAT